MIATEHHTLSDGTAVQRWICTACCRHGAWLAREVDVKRNAELHAKYQHGEVWSPAHGERQ